MMRTGKNLLVVVTILLILSFLLALVSPQVSYAADGKFPLAFDVWTNKGGEGPIRPGGTFQVGETTTVYARATVDVQARWTVKGPQTVDKGTQFMKGGETYSFSMGQAEAKDSGEWTVTFEGEIPGQGAMDRVTFTVVAASTPSLPAAPAIPPSSKPPALTFDTKIDATNATELDALIALKMAEAALPPHPYLDTDGDGKVTTQDVTTMLKWAVATHGNLLSPAQQEIVDALGQPSHFTLTYLPESATGFNLSVRTEVWCYPAHQKKITFIAGDIQAAEDYVPEFEQASYSRLKPEDFDCFMNYEQVVRKIGGAVEKVDLLPEIFVEQGMESYLTDKAVFVMANNTLLYLSTFGTDEGAKLSERIGDIFSGLFPTDVLTPKPVLAKNPFKFIWEDVIKRGARFVQRVPTKVTEAILPRKIAPYVAAIIEVKVGRLPAWRVAAKVNDVAKLENELKKVRDSYRKQTQDIDAMLKALKTQQNQLNQGPSTLGMNVFDWQAQRKSVDELIPALEQILAKLRTDADRLNIKDLMRIALGDALQKTLKNAERIMLKEVSEELHRLGLNNVIKILLEQGPKGLLNANNVIQLIVNGDVERMLKANGLDPNLKDDITKQILEELKKNKDYVLKNWKKVLDETAKRITAQRPKKPTVPDVPKPPAAKGDLAKFNRCHIQFNVRGTGRYNPSGNSPDHSLIYGWVADGSFSGLIFSGSLVTGQHPDERGVSGTIKVTLEATATPNIYKLVSFQVTDSYYIPDDLNARAIDKGTRRLIGPRTPLEAKYVETWNEIFTQTTGTQTCNIITSYTEEVTWPGGGGYSITGFRCDKESHVKITFSVKK